MLETIREYGREASPHVERWRPRGRHMPCVSSLAEEMELKRRSAGVGVVCATGAGA